MSAPPRRAPGVKRERLAPELSAEEIAQVRAMVVWQDSHAMAFDKPAGLSSQGGRGQANTLDELLWAFRRSSGARPVLVHRLDRDTSGVILAAKTRPAAAALGKAWMARQVRKTYLALLPPGAAASGVVDTPLRRVEAGREAWTEVASDGAPGAEAALTRYRTLAASAGGALAEVRPETGRMHQIRVHMAHLGRPLIGDARYGGALTAGGAPAPRLMLHAFALDFPHPEGGRRRVSAPPPADFAQLAATLGLDLAGALERLADRRVEAA